MPVPPSPRGSGHWPVAVLVRLAMRWFLVQPDNTAGQWSHGLASEVPCPPLDSGVCWLLRLAGATVGQYTANRARSCASDASPPHALRCRSKSHSRVSSIWRPTPVRQSVWIAAHIAPTPSGASSTTLAPAPPNPAVEFRSHGHAVPTRFSACFSASRSLSTQRLPSRPQEVLLGL